MQTKNTSDRIDSELSKIFFSSAFSQDAQKELKIKKRKEKRERILKYISFSLLALLLAAGFTALLFFNRVQINIVVENADKSSAGNTAGDNVQNPAPAQDLYLYNAKEKFAETAPLAANESLTLFDFENGDDGWEIPAWTYDKTDHTGKTLKQHAGLSSSGNSSLELYAELEGDKWTAALVEIQKYFNLINYNKISVDIYLPETAPPRIRGKIILTAGPDWKFIEMTRSVRLSPGAWTTITANISPESRDWKKTTITPNVKEDIRKISVRIESTNIAYSGPIYIDNIKLTDK